MRWTHIDAGILRFCPNNFMEGMLDAVGYTVPLPIRAPAKSVFYQYRCSKRFLGAAGGSLRSDDVGAMAALG